MVRVVVSNTAVLYAETHRMGLVAARTLQEQAGGKITDPTVGRKKATRGNESVLQTRELVGRELE